jgi:hypothetical protein
MSKSSDEFKAEVPYKAFPNGYVPDSVKETKGWGLAIGQAIQYEWFNRGGSDGRFFAQWDSFHRRRLYARAQQPTQQYKNELSVKGDLSYLNLDWTNVPIVPKMVDIVVNGMDDRMFDVKAFGQDADSMARRERHREVMEKDMVSRSVLEHVEDQFGVNAFNTDPDNLPQDDEELNLRMELDYKDDLELAAEASIFSIHQENRVDELKRKLLYDQTVLGICVAKDAFYENDTVREEYVDPANLIYSYTEDPRFRDCFYFGEVKNVPVIELAKINSDLTSEDLSNIAKYGQDWYSQNQSASFYNNTIFGNDTVTILDFTYKTTKKIVHKVKNDGNRVIEKDDDWDPDPEMMEERGFSKTEREIEVWYEGVMVAGTNYILKWEVAPHMVRPKTSTQRADAKFKANAPRMYKGSIDSIVERMIPFANLIQIVHLKMQQVIQRIVPDGVFIDADGINEVDLGNGATYNPDEALKMYLQTGSIVGRSYTGDGEFNHARVPIQELNKNSGQSKLASLISSYNHYLSGMRDVTGINEARDGSDLDPNSLVGVQKLAALNSNTATRHILYAVLDVVKDLSYGVIRRASDALQYGGVHREEFIRKLGAHNVELIESIGNLHLHDFAIYIELAPDEEERAKMEANIQMALNRDQIEIEDAIDIREVRNVKYANQLLKVRKRKRKQQEMRERAAEKQMDTQNQMAIQNNQARIKQQETMMETNGLVAVERAKAGFKIEQDNNQAKLKKDLMQTEAAIAIQLKKVDVQGLVDKERLKEDAKDKRIDRQSTQQSKLIEQRQKGLSPINFESNEDSLDGFDLAEFDPR